MLVHGSLSEEKSRENGLSTKGRHDSSPSKNMLHESGVWVGRSRKDDNLAKFGIAMTSVKRRAYTATATFPDHRWAGAVVEPISFTQTHIPCFK